MINFILLFVILPTATLAAAFGTAWPLVETGERWIRKWEQAPDARKVLYSIGIFIIGVIAIVAAVIDIIANYVAGTIVFHELPEEGNLFLTNRIQRCLDDAAIEAYGALPKYAFTWYQWLYIKIVVRIANFIDRSPHFVIPENIRHLIYA